MTEPSEPTPLRPVKRAARSADPTQDQPLLVLGRGRDTFSQRDRGYALEDHAIVKARSGQRVDYTIKKIESTSDLKENLAVGASASFSGLLGSGSAKAGFVARREINAFHVYLLVHCTVDNGRKGMRTFALNDAARTLVGSPDFRPAEFHRKYGDEFVSAVTTGGEFFVLYEFKTTSATRRREVTAKLEGVIGNFKGAADLAQTLTAVQGMSGFEAHLFVNGGTFVNDEEGPGLPQLDADALITFSREFPATVAGDGEVVLAEETTDYLAVDGFPAVDVPYARNRYALADLAELYDTARSYRAAVAYARSQPDQFQLPGQTRQPEPDELVAGVENVLSTCDDDLADVERKIEAAVRRIAVEPWVDHTASAPGDAAGSVGVASPGVVDPLAEELRRIRATLPVEPRQPRFRLGGLAGGSVDFYYKGRPGWTLNEGEGPREAIEHVRFDPPFPVVPTVHAFLVSFDLPPSYVGGDPGAPQDHDRVSVWADPAKVTREGFEVRVRTWGWGRADAVGVGWLAIAQ